MQNTLLQNRFNKEILESIKTMKKEVYSPTRFIIMLHKANNDAYSIVPKIISKNTTIGLEKLYEKNRLDLSVEATIIKPEYKELFPVEIINICRRKLKMLGYIC